MFFFFANSDKQGVKRSITITSLDFRWIKQRKKINVAYHRFKSAYYLKGVKLNTQSELIFVHKKTKSSHALLLLLLFLHMLLINFCIMQKIYVTKTKQQQ